MSGVCVLGDFRHSLALFPGDKESVQDIFNRFARNLKEWGSEEEIAHLRVLECGTDVSEREMAYMLENRKIPRRVSIRFGSGT